MAKSDDYILVVEDDDELRETLADVLHEEGLASCTASNGQEALAFLRAAAPPCLILVDQMMPVMGGDELIKALRTIPGLARVPICAMTADARSAPDDVDAVFTKPIDLAALLRVIEHHCGRRVLSDKRADERDADGRRAHRGTRATMGVGPRAWRGGPRPPGRSRAEPSRR